MIPNLVKHVLQPRSLSLLLLLAVCGSAEAQITAPRILSASEQRTAKLEEFLINRLRATTENQQAYVREIVRLVEEGKLELRIVLAMQRYSERRSPFFPLPFFERALKVEAGKRGVAVPMIKDVIATRRPKGQPARATLDTRITF